MTPRQIADISVARLGLPVPTGKLVVMHVIAEALAAPETAGDFEDALVDWTATRRLESECLEALSVLLIAQARPELVKRVRAAVSRPSLASEYLAALASGAPAIVRDWRGCHSGKAPHHVDVRTSEELLSSGAVVPPIFQDTVERLEEISGCPMSRQWAYEFDVLSDRFKDITDGYLSYFQSRDRSTGGQFVAGQGQMARSAFLRTLACAVELWGMPEKLAARYAHEALPADPIYLKLRPGPAPQWAQGLHHSFDDESRPSEIAVRDCLRLIEREEQGRLLHLCATVSDTELRHIELTLFGVSSPVGVADAKTGVRFHRWMAGRLYPKQNGLRSLTSPSWQKNDDLDFSPAVLPLIGSSVGYLQFDYVKCFPYVPFSTPSMPDLELLPAAGRLPLMSQGVHVGEFNSWYWEWQPSRPIGWASPMACYSMLSAQAAQTFEADAGAPLRYVWLVEKWTRDKAYGDWIEEREIGSLSEEAD